MSHSVIALIHRHQRGSILTLHVQTCAGKGLDGNAFREGVAVTDICGFIRPVR